MEFKLIDLSTWDRREYFEYYLNQVPCTYSMTLNMDLTILFQEIKRRDFNLYPTMIYLISAIVNRHEEFRTAFGTNDTIGIFDRLHPSYTIFQKDNETFTNIWTEFIPSFSDFYTQYLFDVEQYGKVKSFFAKPNSPSNIFTISCIPWITFTGFNLNLSTATKHLLPIFTTGKYFEKNGKILLPIAIQVHHAVCDGFHTARFMTELQEAMNTFFTSEESI